MADVTDRIRAASGEHPEQRFTQEQVHLQALPGTDFDTSYFDIRHVAGMAIEVGREPLQRAGKPVSHRMDPELAG